MENKKINARLVSKHDIEANWLKATKFTPFEGEIIVYCKEEEGDILPEGRSNLIKYDRIKIGDGVNNVNDLPFLKAESDVIEKSAEGGYTFGTEEDNLQTTSEHSALFGSNITAGVRGLKIYTTTVNHDANNKPESLTIATVENAQDFYNEEAGFVPGETRAALILAHHSFETFKVIAIANNVISLSPIVEGGMMPDSYYALHEDNETRNYLWLYNIEERYDMPYFNIDVNKNCPVRPEADFTYGLGDNINIVGRSSFSSGMGNQNMGWYSATMGRFNTAYYAGFALGAYNKSLGTYSVALNQNTEATATGATSKGYLTKASANYAEAGGQETEANHKASFTHGLRTKSGRQHQAVVGEYNEENKTALFVVGNGSGGQKASASETISYEISKTHTLSHKNIIPGTVVATDRVYTFGDKEYKSESFKIDYENGTITTDENFPAYMGTLPLTTTYEYYLGDNGIVRSNALEVEKDGSATIGKTGSKENSVATKGYVNDRETESHRYTDSLGDYFTIEDEWLDSCVQPTTQERGNYFITKLDDNATPGGVIKHSTNYSKEYIDSFKYSLSVCVTEANTSVSGFGNAVGPHINIGTFDGVEVFIQFRVGSLFLWGVEKLGDKIQTSGLGTTTSPAQVTGAKIEVGKNYKIEIEKNGSTLFCAVGEYHFSFAEKQSLTFVPNFLINCRYSNCSISDRKLVSRYNKLQSLAGKDELNSALVDAKKYTDSKLASGYSIITNDIESECIIEHLDMSNLEGQSYDLGHINIVPGSVEIIPDGDAPSYDSGEGILYRISSGRETYLIDYKTGIISNIPKLVLYTDCEIRFKYYVYNEVNSPSTDLLNTFTDNKIEKYFNKFNNYIIENNNYIHLENISAEKELYGITNSECNEFFELNNKGFMNARFKEKENTGGIPGANPNNTVNRYIILSNNYANSYEDFLIKINIDLKDIYASQTGIEGATGLIIFPFENAAGIQIRQSGHIVSFLGGYTTKIAVSGINTVGQYTLYFKYLKSVGILNIYKDSLDNLITSIQLTPEEMATLKPQLAFGGRCCTYSAECEIHKADFKIKNITKEAYDNLTVKDPYVYYTVDGTSAIEDALDDIIDMQENLIGGNA